MEAYEASTKAGNEFVETDCWLLKGDENIGLMHDAPLARTTGSDRYVPQLTAREWGDLKIDGTKLLGHAWGKYHAPFLDEVLARFRNQKIVFVEPKDGRSGAAIVAKLKEYGISKDYAVVNSGYPTQLKAAINAGYKACINLGDLDQDPNDLKKKGYWGVLIPYKTNRGRIETYISELHAVGLKVLGQTNGQTQREEMIKLGFDGIYTDDPLYMALNGNYRKNTDSYKTQTWAAGMHGMQPDGRGYFTPPDKWGMDSSQDDSFKSCLQGWMCPIGGSRVALEWKMTLSITFGPRFTEGRWASVAILMADTWLDSDVAPTLPLLGYNILFLNNGGISMNRYDGAARNPPTAIATTTGPAIAAGETVRFSITTTPGQIRIDRLDGKASLVVQDRNYRGAYVAFGTKGQRADFSDVVLSVP